MLTNEIIKKMKHPKRDQFDTIIFNEDITITNIPKEAYEYVVNGKFAIKWVMEQYQVKKDSKSGIIDNPNDFSDNEEYIFNLLLRIINVSVQTIELKNDLPPLEIEED
ncbi:type ISP restriction/modification enzyme [Salinicoccus siamensis]|uniref:Type ISP restriction/modification enzyme n=1 Tax=Salinicoccus siamensis TaxID=381830 RepID=A0ABV5Z1K0_9STAP